MRKPEPPADWPDRFLVEFAKTGNVSDAARRAKVTRQAVYAHAAADEAFSKAWQQAREQAADALELEAFRRAVRGCRKPVFYRGEKCGEVLEYSDTLLLALLKANRPDRFAERSKTEHSGSIGHTHEFPDLDKLRELPPDELLRLHRETLGLPGADRRG